MKQFEPMLAASMKAEKGQCVESLVYPVMVSPKLDGIRCLVLDGKILSRRMKPIPNRYVQEVLGRHARMLNGLDGELMVKGGFNDVSSAIMSRDGEPDFIYQVFDCFNNPQLPYHIRAGLYRNVVDGMRVSCVRSVPVEVARTPSELTAKLEKYLAAGHEGLMTRSWHGPYKFGRSTWGEQYLVKVKPFEDAEAMIVGFEEQLSNNNEAKRDAFGRIERSSHKANKTGKGTLGKLIVNRPEFGEFAIGTGFDDALRQEIWDNRKKYLYRMVTFKFQRIGTKDKPRLPVFKGFRHRDDT